jgi:indole-3-glycerol phosphate synthase
MVGERPHNFLRKLVDNSYRALDSGLYDKQFGTKSHDVLNLKKCIVGCTYIPVIAEIKYASPSQGVLMDENLNPLKIAERMVNSGAVGISVLTQPYEFRGSLEHLFKIRNGISVPILMKDIVVSDVQIYAAKMEGADSVLLIKSVFDNDMAEGDIEKYLDYANRLGLNAIVEVHTESEFAEALKLVIYRGGDNLIGINNRNLNTLEVDTSITSAILTKRSKANAVVISESGISNAETIRNLRLAGADGFLIGTSLVKSADIESKLGELTQAQ